MSGNLFSGCIGTLVALAGMALPASVAWGQGIDFELFTRLTHKVLKVEAMNTDGSVSMGTGVLVGDGFVVTNCHVTARARTIELVRGEFRWEVEAQRADVEHDLCVLRAPHSGDLAPAEMRLDAPQIGQTVHAVGFIFGIAPRLNVGEINALHDYDGAKVIQSTTPFTSGASGGGLFDDKGRLVGIVTFRYRAGEAFHFSLPVSWIVDAIRHFDGHAVAPLKGTPFWGRPRDQQPHFLRAATYAAEGDWVGMAHVASEWTRLEPDSASAWRTLGVSRSRLKQLEAAIPALRRSVSLDGGYAPSWYELGLALAGSGKRSEATAVQHTLQGLNDRLSKDLMLALDCAEPASLPC